MTPGSLARIAVLISALGIASLTRAELVAITVSGYVTNTSGNAIPGIALYDNFYAVIVYDSSDRALSATTFGVYRDLVRSFSAAVGTNSFSLAPRTPSHLSSEMTLADDLQVLATYSDEVDLKIAATPSLDTNATFFFRIGAREAGSSPPSALRSVSLPPLGTLYFSELSGYLTRQSAFEPRECRFRVVYFRHSTIPRLITSLSGTNIVLSWPASSPNFYPQMSDRADANWSWVTNQRVLAETNFRVTRPIIDAKTFYRLRMD